MARFNKRQDTRRPRAAGAGAITTERTQSGLTHQGGAGYARGDAKSELFLLAVADMVGTDTFYERAGQRDERFESLVRRVAVTDPDWLARFIPWLRTGANMRTASLVAAAEAVKARLDANLRGLNRQLISAACRRADEPGELLAYWTGHHGRAVPKPVKRGLADAVARLYTPKALLKYDTAARGFRFGDVIELVHPAPHPEKPWQGQLFAYALDRRHHPESAVPPPAHGMLTANRDLAGVPVERRRALLRAPDAAERLGEAGFTWEMLAGWLQGPLDAAAWEAIIPSMGYFALLRNLRNFDQAGVSDLVAARVRERIADPKEVAASRLLPLRFLAAYQNTEARRWAHALEQGLTHALHNVPKLGGRTLILVDRSGSMFGTLSERTQLNRADAAALFGTALALRASNTDLVQFGTTSQAVRFTRDEPVLRVMKRFENLGGTNTAQALRAHYAGHDRVIVLTDEQASYDPVGVTRSVPQDVPVYTWNLAGYRFGHAPSGGSNRHTFGGLTDQAFATIPLLEAGAEGRWPF